MFCPQVPGCSDTFIIILTLAATPTSGTTSSAESPAAARPPVDEKPLLDASRPRSDSSTITVIVESLSPLRGHAVEVNGLKDTVGKLKALYVARRADEAAARTGARSPSAGADITPPGYEMRVRLIRDGVELVDGVSLASAGIADGSRLVALEVRERAGLLWRGLRALGRWWPLLFCCWIALTIVVGTIDFTPGVDGHHACDRPLLSFLGMSAALLVPYGIVFSGAVQAEEGHRILWFLRSRKLSIVVAVIGIGAANAVVSRR